MGKTAVPNLIVHYKNKNPASKTDRILNKMNDSLLFAGTTL